MPRFKGSMCVINIVFSRSGLFTPLSSMKQYSICSLKVKYIFIYTYFHFRSFGVPLRLSVGSNKNYATTSSLSTLICIKLSCVSFSRSVGGNQTHHRLP